MPLAENPGEPLEKSIGEQVRHYRIQLSLTASDLADRTGLSKAMISKVESASASCSLSTLARLADGLGVPVTALFRSLETDREASFTKSGEGAVVVRSGTRRGHEYQVLGQLRGRPNALEPTLVTLTSSSDVFPLFQHTGTEFLYMLEGEMVYSHGPHRYQLLPGDSLLFEGEAPHGPAELVSLPILFLAIADPQPAASKQH
ncbi:XRE family transcriptional regulator [Citricoccus sp. NPDC079358]|uniref:XRE family transcriptional regulator n=1 Tax=Citricoccus muralis TaxID=169134 RepID=A0A3D9LDE7_9MICC|nr:XRE family transcriptional regulator [Citricoccus muralis]REE04172.1 XRE family transcriptional regulator [Citricoccus muralis]